MVPKERPFSHEAMPQQSSQTSEENELDASEMRSENYSFCFIFVMQ